MPSSLAHGRVGAPEGQGGPADTRRAVPRTDVLLAEPRIAAATERLGRSVVKAAVGAAQDRARRGEIAPSEVADAVLGCPDGCLHHTAAEPLRGGGHDLTLWRANPTVRQA